MLFFGVFQTLGAVFVGLGVRQMLEGDSGGKSQIFVGAIFAGTGTLFSALFMRELNAWAFPVSVMFTVFIALSTIILPKEILERFGAIAASMAIGGFGMLMGGAVLIGTLQAQQDILFGILFAGCWGSVGFAFFLTGLGALLQGKRLRFKQNSPGKYEIAEADQEQKSN